MYILMSDNFKLFMNKEKTPSGVAGELTGREIGYLRKGLHAAGLIDRG